MKKSSFWVILLLFLIGCSIDWKTNPSHQKYPIERLSQANQIYEISPPIIINGNDDFISQAIIMNWTGDGTFSNPYIIQNYNITSNANVAISISNVSVYFRVQKNWISEVTNGILLKNITNGEISENIIQRTQKYGISGDNLDSVVVRHNNITGASQTGFYVKNSKNCLIQENVITECKFYGFDMSSIQNITFFGNQLLTNRIAGCNFGDTQNIVIQNNTIWNNTQIGMNIGGSTNVLIEGNTIANSSNLLTYGPIYNLIIQKNIFCNATQLAIKIGGINNTIRNNTFWNTGWSAIGIFGDDAISIIDNNFFDTQKCIDDRTISNESTTISRNYYSYWYYPDENLDGFIDIPYPINNFDYPNIIRNDSYPRAAPILFDYPVPHILTIPYFNEFNYYSIKFSSESDILVWMPSVDSLNHSIEYTIFYSTDNGSNFQVLVSHISSTIYPIPKFLQRNYKNIIFKVTACCGEGMCRSNQDSSINYVIQPDTRNNGDRTFSDKWGPLFGFLIVVGIPIILTLKIKFSKSKRIHRIRTQLMLFNIYFGIAGVILVASIDKWAIIGLGIITGLTALFSLIIWRVHTIKRKNWLESTAIDFSGNIELKKDFLDTININFNLQKYLEYAYILANDFFTVGKYHFGLKKKQYFEISFKYWGECYAIYRLYPNLAREILEQKGKKTKNETLEHEFLLYITNTGYRLLKINPTEELFQKVLFFAKQILYLARSRLQLISRLKFIGDLYAICIQSETDLQNATKAIKYYKLASSISFLIAYQVLFPTNNTEEIKYILQPGIKNKNKEPITQFEDPQTEIATDKLKSEEPEPENLAEFNIKTPSTTKPFKESGSKPLSEEPLLIYKNEEDLENNQLKEFLKNKKLDAAFHFLRDRQSDVANFEEIIYIIEKIADVYVKIRYYSGAYILLQDALKGGYSLKAMPGIRIKRKHQSGFNRLIKKFFQLKKMINRKQTAYNKYGNFAEILNSAKP
jgi:parallel beta-helix repeat protein